MSIATELNRNKAAKTAIKEAINAKGGTLTDELLGAYADAIANLPSGSSMDFYKCAAVYGPRDVKTVVISGCPTDAVNGTYLPTGQTTTNYDGTAVYPIYKHETSDYYYYYDAGNWMSWVIGTNHTGNKLFSGEVGSSFYDAEWNTVSGMAGAYDSQTVDADVPKTWDGYKAVLTDGVYSFEESITAGLTYSVVTPKINGIYSADALVEVKNLYDGSDPSLVFYASLSAAADTAETGQSLTENGTVSYETVDGIQCAYFPGSYLTSSDLTSLPVGSADRTLSAWAKAANDDSDRYGLVSYGNPDSADQLFAMEVRNRTVAVSGAYNAANEAGGSTTVDVSQWHHYALVYKSGVVYFYIDGAACGTFEYTYNTVLKSCYIGSFDNSIGTATKHLAAARIYNRALSDSEIAELAEEFTPTA